MCIEFKHLSIKSMHMSVNILHRINIKYKLSRDINIKHKLSQNRLHNRKYSKILTTNEKIEFTQAPIF